MPSRPDVPCAGGCGKLVWRGTGSRPQPTCRECRRKIREETPRCTICGGLMSHAWISEWQNGHHHIETPTCGDCKTRASKELRASGERTCQTCGKTKTLFEFGGLDSHGHLRGTICTSCGWTARAGKRGKSSQTSGRRRRAANRDTYDGITDDAILERDGRTCLVPRCLHPASRAIGYQPWPDPWSVTIDHIIPIDLDGPDSAENKRPAHKRCNESRGNRISADDSAAHALLEIVATMSKLP